MRLADFDYELPQDRIAQEPAAVRDRARLLVHERARDSTQHVQVHELLRFLRPGDLLVVNDTRVLRARLHTRRTSGGRVEVFFLEPTGAPGVWAAFLNPARRLRPGERLTLEGAALHVRLLSRRVDGEGQAGMDWSVQVEDSAGARVDPTLAMEQAGHVPLPPYVTRGDDEHDAERYQTVYASAPGAVAAPTAGLHFTPELLTALEGHGVARAAVTLHVGPGTFQPVKSERIEEHAMHSERYELSAETAQAVRRAREAGGRIVAVGTTSVRVLESCADERGELLPGAGSTRLFLYPGARFRVVDALLTNFHLPRSTLLMLVAAFAGRERVLGLYREALERGYRFYSYGDAMLLL